MEKVGDIYPYGIDWPVCLSDSASTEKRWFLEKIVSETLGRPIPKWHRSDYVPKGNRQLLQFDACAEEYMTEYLNMADVQEALHAKADTKWRSCGGVLYNYGDSLIPMQPKYEYLCNIGGLKMAIYSGDGIHSLYPKYI